MTNYKKLLFISLFFMWVHNGLGMFNWYRTNPRVTIDYSQQRAHLEKEIAQVKKELRFNFYAKVYTGATGTISTLATLLYATAWFLEGTGTDNEYPISTLSTAAVSVVSATALVQLETESIEHKKRLVFLEKTLKEINTPQ